MFLKIFHWKSYWKSKILKILKISIFRFLIRFSMENFQKYFWDFRDFFEIFSILDFVRKSRNFQLFLMIFFKKCFNFQSWVNNVATAMLFNRQKHNISKQTCSTKKHWKRPKYWWNRHFPQAIGSEVTKSALESY